MSATPREPGDYPVARLDTFIKTVLDPSGTRIVVLRADVGFGKTHALLALVSQLMQEQPTAQVLLLNPASLRSQSLERLRGLGTPTLLVDRYKFRELLDANAGNGVWPRGVALVLSDDFARKPDVMESLAEVQWDLVVADEAHRFTGARANLLNRVGATAKRVVLASATGMSLPDGLVAEGATVVEWRREERVDDKGKPLDTAQRPTLHEVSFTLSAAERHLSETVRALGELLDVGTPQSKFIAKILLRNRDSSPAALESILRRLRNSAAHAREIDLIEEGDFDDVEEQERTLGDPATAGKILPIATEALQELEAMATDSKVAAFRGLMIDLALEKRAPGRMICVTTDFLATLYYLAAEVEEQGLAYSLINSRMPYEDRLKSLATFENTGSILLATTGALRGIDLPNVTDLVPYDLPDSDRLLYVLLTRSDRIRSIHALVQSDGADNGLLEPLRRLCEPDSAKEG
jgi:superfamily II DNA or RNA helicase